MKKARIITGNGDIIVQETEGGLTEIIVSELEFNNGRVKVQGARDGGIRNYGREHAYILTDPELESVRRLINKHENQGPSDRTVEIRLKSLKDEGWIYKG